MYLKILTEHEGERLDRWLTDQRPEFSRSRIQKLIAEGAVCVNGRAMRASYRVVAGDVITFDIPAAEPVAINPEDIPLDIFFEDEEMPYIK